MHDLHHPEQPNSPRVFPAPPAPQFAPPAPQHTPAAVGAQEASTALILAILGLVVCGPVGVVAFVKARRAKAEAQRTGLPLDSTMNAAYIMGAVATVMTALGAAFIALWIVLLAVSAAA